MSGTPRTGEHEVPRASTRSVAPPSTVRPPRPSLPPVRVDDEMTTMMPSRSAASLPPPPDAMSARIPRQWSPVNGEAPASSHHPSTLPSFVPPTPSSFQPMPLSSAVPTPPSSLQGLTVQNTSPSIAVDTARVRTSGLAKVARPTLSWAAALVALGIFVGIGSAFLNRGEASAKTKAAAAKVDTKDANKGDKKSALAAKVNASTQAAAKAAPPPPALPAMPANQAALGAQNAQPNAQPVQGAPLAQTAMPSGVVPPGFALPAAAPVAPMQQPVAQGVVQPAPIAAAPVMAVPGAAYVPPAGAPMPSARRSTVAAAPVRTARPVAQAEAAPEAPAAAAPMAPAPAAPKAKKPSSKEASDLANAQLADTF